MSSPRSGRYVAKALQVVARAIAARKLKLTASGLEHVPPSGPVIIACHHYHHLYDGVALLATATRPLQLLVALDWAQPGGVRQIMEAACRLAGWPTILRPDRRRAVRTLGPTSTASAYRARLEHGLSQSLGILRANGALVVFPEGHPTIDPHPNPKHRALAFLPFKRGFADLAVRAAAERNEPIPVVPVAFRYESQGSGWQVAMEVGAPRWVTAADSPLTITCEVEAAARTLAGEPVSAYRKGHA